MISARKWKSSRRAPVCSSIPNAARVASSATRRSPASRFLWCVVASGQLDPIAAGRTGEIARARTVAEAALGAYAADRHDLSGGTLVFGDEGDDTGGAGADRAHNFAGHSRTARLFG